MSMGVAEHFIGEERLKALQAHFYVLREGGLAIIDVPHKSNPPYMLWKFLSQKFGRWNFGEEYPYTLREFKRFQKPLNVTFDFIGGYLFEDQFLILKRIKKRLGLKDRIKVQRGTFLDKYLSRTLTAVAKK